MNASGAIFIIHFLVKQTFAKRVQLFKKLSISLLYGVIRWTIENLSMSGSYLQYSSLVAEAIEGLPFLTIPSFAGHDSFSP